ncbi:hypothetical protein GIB67_006974 [Kingdonia uniflora]|uniref:Uncharacterized protein n=1 Tax=Kingdonia uniflora TaxID=39325 RepID=A0A7J7NZ44_9MAGN|nr:hypothetical protein GIB67_006974 [Kingdonia uniflora]
MVLNLELVLLPAIVLISLRTSLGVLCALEAWSLSTVVVVGGYLECWIPCGSVVSPGLSVIGELLELTRKMRLLGLCSLLGGSEIIWLSEVLVTAVVIFGELSWRLILQLLLSGLLRRGIEYLEFKPSEVAAAVSISVIRETNLDKYEPYIIKNVQKEGVFKCLELIHELQRSATVQSVPHNPIEVVDISCLSYKSDELPTLSSTNSSQADSDFKRVNLNKPSDMD